MFIRFTLSDAQANVETEDKGLKVQGVKACESLPTDKTNAFIGITVLTKITSSSGKQGN
jgi:hypothetical protein